MDKPHGKTVRLQTIGHLCEHLGTLESFKIWSGQGVPPFARQKTRVTPDLDSLVLNLALATVKIDRELSLVVSLDLPTAVLGLNDEAEVLDTLLSESASSSTSSLYGDFATFWPFSLTLIVIFTASAL